MKGELRDISVLVADLREFTGLTAALGPRQVLEIINRYFESMTEIIVDQRGTIDEFTGDGILVFFGAPQAIPDHCRHAVRCALDMQEAMGALNMELSRVALPELRMGIGVNCGQLIVGNIGSEKRKKYGALGSPINLAFRIEAQTVGGEVLVSPEIHSHLNGQLVVDQARESLLQGLMILSLCTEWSDCSDRFPATLRHPQREKVVRKWLTKRWLLKGFSGSNPRTY